MQSRKSKPEYSVSISGIRECARQVARTSPLLFRQTLNQKYFANNLSRSDSNIHTPRLSSASRVARKLQNPIAMKSQYCSRTRNRRDSKIQRNHHQKMSPTNSTKHFFPGYHSPLQNKRENMKTKKEKRKRGTDSSRRW